MLQRCLHATDAGRLLKQIKEQEKAERAERAEHKRQVDMRRRELHETQKRLELQAQKLWQDQQNKLRLMMQAVNHKGRVARNAADCAEDSTSAGSGAACSGATRSSNSPNVLTELEVALIQEHHVHEGMELRQQILEASREEAHFPGLAGGLPLPGGRPARDQSWLRPSPGSPGMKYPDNCLRCGTDVSSAS